MKTSKLSLMKHNSQFLKINNVLGLVCSVVLSAASTQAADRFWSGGTADYTNTTGTGGVVPGAADNAINTNGTGNAVRISVGNPDWAVNQIRAGTGNAGDGAFVQNGQAVTLGGTNFNGSVVTEFVTPFRLGISNKTGVYTLNARSLQFRTRAFNF